jgi:hypothetical protein
MAAAAELEALNAATRLRMLQEEAEAEARMAARRRKYEEDEARDAAAHAAAVRRRQQLQDAAEDEALRMLLRQSEHAAARAESDRVNEMHRQHAMAHQPRTVFSTAGLRAALPPASSGGGGRCNGITQKGVRCQNPAQAGRRFCHHH